MTTRPPSRTTPRTPVERQRKYRASLQERGLERIALVLDARAVRLMRGVARDHNKALGEVCSLGLFLAQRELQAMAARKAGGQ